MYEALSSCRGSEVVMTLDQIAEMVGGLPEAARKARWWTNSALTKQARAWLYAGWKVSRRELNDERLTFRKIA
ncbi:MAG: DUF7662 domain-containing protein [Acidimicrobiales bacterium]